MNQNNALMPREPLALYRDCSLSKGARLVLVLLWRFVDGPQQQSGTWLAVVPKQELRHRLGIPRSSLNRFILDLRRSRWVVSASPQGLDDGSWTFELSNG